MAEDLGERTEEATPRKRQEAREEGNVARSQDFAGALMLLVLVLVLWAAAAWILGRGKILLAQTLDGSFIDDPLSADEALHLLGYLGRWGIQVAAPVLLVAWGVAFATQLMQVGWLLAPKAVRPQLSKLNPINGAKRIFGLTGLVKATLDALKVVVVVAVAVATILPHVRELVLLPQLPALQLLPECGRLLLELSLKILAALLLLGLLDFVWQRYKHSRDLRMTKQEVQDEMKQTEGDPEVKRRRLRMAQQIALQRIGAAVPKADVVVTNPQHLAVAVRYDAERMRAPTVVAKGADLMAFRIRQLALQHGIPVIERKPLARALYRQVEVGQEIPPELYQAVAEILAYVYQLDGRMAG